MKNYRTNIIQEDCSIEEALRKLNEISDIFPDHPLTLLILNKRQKLVGTLTDGDVRRTLVAGSKLDDRISSCMNKDFVSLKKNGIEYHNISKYKEKGVKLLPIQNDSEEIVKVYNLTKVKSILPLETIIMAGGKGTRLRPMTFKTPKSLLEVGDKPIIQHNVDRLLTYGIENITFTVRYLGDQIVSYFSNGNGEGVNVRFIREDEPLGTAGGLSLIDEFKSETILLTNSDVLTTLNYEEFYLDFIQREADISVVTIPYTVKVPYGVFDMENSCASSLKEKPEYTYFANAGIYLIKKDLIDQIPKNKYLDITDFIEKKIAENKNVVCFPFWGYWLDIGKPEDFENAQKAIQILDSY
jgi:dTDP-glucose pyrophosphorylase